MSSQARVCHMVKKLWIKEGNNRNIKVFVAHDHDVVDFNPIEYSEVLEELDCTIRVSCIQAADSVAAGFSPWFAPHHEPKHWTCLIKEHPKLNRIDVEVIIQNIEAQASEIWNNKKAAEAAHVHTATENKDAVNKALMSIMNNLRK